MNFNCTSCGAELDHGVARCPYCGTLIPGGAEKEYMEKLDSIREDMGASPWSRRTSASLWG